MQGYYLPKYLLSQFESSGVLMHCIKVISKANMLHKCGPDLSFGTLFFRCPSFARIREELKAEDSAGATRLPPPTLGEAVGIPQPPDELLFLELTRGGGMGRVRNVLGLRKAASGTPPPLPLGVSYS